MQTLLFWKFLGISWPQKQKKKKLKFNYNIPDLGPTGERSNCFFFSTQPEAPDNPPKCLVFVRIIFKTVSAFLSGFCFSTATVARASGIAKKSPKNLIFQAVRYNLLSVRI